VCDNVSRKRVVHVVVVVWQHIGAKRRIVFWVRKTIIPFL
jgi:hypothetical protein